MDAEQLSSRLLQALRIGVELGQAQAPEEASTWRYRSFCELVLIEGAVFTEIAALDSAELGPAGNCFANARVCSSEHGLAYVEGWAATDRAPFGVEHAWCLTDDGLVLDPTWPSNLGAVYVGLAVSAGYRRSVAHPSLLHPHPDGLDLLRKGLPATAQIDAGNPLPRPTREAAALDG